MVVSGVLRKWRIKRVVCGVLGAYVENAVDAAELLHAHHENCESSVRAYVPGEDVEETGSGCGVFGAHERDISSVGRARGIRRAMSFKDGWFPDMWILGLLALCMANAQDVPCCGCFRLATTKSQPSRRGGEPKECCDGESHGETSENDEWSAP